MRPNPVPALKSTYGGCFSNRWSAPDNVDELLGCNECATTEESYDDFAAMQARRFGVGKSREEYSELMAVAEQAAEVTLAVVAEREEAARRQEEMWAEQAKLTAAMNRRYAGEEEEEDSDEEDSSDVLDYYPGSEASDEHQPQADDFEEFVAFDVTQHGLQSKAA